MSGKTSTMNIEQQPQQPPRPLERLQNEQADNNSNDEDSDNRVGGDTSTIVTNSTTASVDTGGDQSSSNDSNNDSTATSNMKLKSSSPNKRGRSGNDLNGNDKVMKKQSKRLCVDELDDNDETIRSRDMVMSSKKQKFDAIEQEDDDSYDDRVMKTTVAAQIVGKSTVRRRVDDDDDDSQKNNKMQKMASACRTILECIGEDPNREGLLRTPERWAKALCFFCSGYEISSPAEVTNGAVFAENHNEMVVVRNLDIHSLCEHHMVPFTGRVHIGYIPNGQVIGLSKLGRIAEMYARRLQVQERLTRQIADAINETVEPLGVAVVVECAHMCMVMRGIQKVGAVTTTSAVRGCFETNSKTRAEFFSIIHGNGGMRFC